MLTAVQLWLGALGSVFCSLTQQCPFHTPCSCDQCVRRTRVVLLVFSGFWAMAARAHSARTFSVPHRTFTSFSPAATARQAGSCPGAGSPCPGWILGHVAGCRCSASSSISPQPPRADPNPVVTPSCWEQGLSSPPLPGGSSLQKFSGTFIEKFQLLGGAAHAQTTPVIRTGTVIALGNAELARRLSRNIRHLRLFPEQENWSLCLCLPRFG